MVASAERNLLRGRRLLLGVVTLALVACAKAGGPTDNLPDLRAGDGPLLSIEDLSQPSFGDLAGLDLIGVDLTGFDQPDLLVGPDMAHPVTGLPATGTWTPIATPNATVAPTTSFPQPVMILHEDKPTLVFVDGKDTRVAQLDAGTWKLIGGPVNGVPGYNTYTPQIASRNGKLFLAFLERQSVAISNNAVWVWSWNGTAWTAVGAPVPIQMNYGTNLSLVVSPTLVPYVSWTAMPVSPGPSMVYVMRFDGTNWGQYGATFNAEGASSSALASKMVMTSTGKLLVSWQESFVHVYENAGSWTALGPNNGRMTSGKGSSTYEQEITVDHQQRPLAAWIELDSTNPDTTLRDASINVARWNSASWDLLTSTPLSVGPGLSPAGLSSITIDGLDSPVVTWVEEVGTPTKIPTLYVKRLFGGTWSFVGQSIVAPAGYQYVSSPQLVIDSYDTATLVFSAQKIAGSLYELFVYRFTP